MLHGFASKILNFPHPAAPALVRPEALHAPALKAPPEAGRRGGESIARIINREALECITWVTSHYMQVVMKEFSSYVMVMFSFINI